MPAIQFQHSYVGSLTIETGVDSADWAYGLNTQTFPTYGGEVVQILSVYIDDLTLVGTVATYEQLEQIYKYFAKYLITATQGHSKTPVPNESYNLDPMIFTYPSRNWRFEIYPKAAPGFAYELGMVGPQWQLQAHIIDDSPDLSVLKDGIKAAVVKNINIAGMNNTNLNEQNGPTLTQGTFSLTGNISPNYQNPNSDPFQTDDLSDQNQQAQASQWADYYSSLIPAYMKGNFSNLVGAVGSQPNFGATRKTNQSAVKVKTKTKKK